MSLVHVDIDTLLTILDAWTGPHRQRLADAPKLAPWLPDLDAMQARLRAFSRAPAATTPTVAIGPIDARAEAALQCLRYLLQAMIKRAIATADADGQARWEAVETRLFADGVAFLQRKAPVQVSSTRRLLELAREADTLAVLATTSLAGTSASDLLDQIETLNEELDRALLARDNTSRPPSPHRQLRLDAIALIHDVQTIIGRQLGEDERKMLLALIPS